MSRCHEYDLICIGSGPEGQRAAIQAAKLGKKVAVIEKQRFVGGVCIDTGTIPSKTFREAVRRMYSLPGLELTDPFAYTPRIRPTMPQLIGHVGRVIQREITMINDALGRNDVALVYGRASFVEAHTIKVAAYNVANKLALVRHATGAAVPAVVAEAVATVPERSRLWGHRWEHLHAFRLSSPWSASAKSLPASVPSMRSLLPSNPGNSSRSLANLGQAKPPCCAVCRAPPR